jgi:CBS domain-containing protein
MRRHAPCLKPVLEDERRTRVTNNAASQTVENLMTRALLVVGPHHTVGVAEAAMRQGDVRHLPVISEDGKLEGVLSDKDLVTAGPGATVSDVMSTEPITIGAEAPVYEAVALMLQHRFNALPVVDDDGNLIGIITSTDMLIAAYEHFTEGHPKRDLGQLDSVGPVEVDRALLAAKLDHVRASDHPAALATAIAELTSFLKHRFGREEQEGGIFSQLVEEEPAREHEIAEMREEHKRIIDRSHALIAENWSRVDQGEDEVAPGALDLVQAVEDHEQREERLLSRSLASP